MKNLKNLSITDNNSYIPDNQVYKLVNLKGSTVFPIAGNVQNINDTFNSNKGEETNEDNIKCFIEVSYILDIQIGFREKRLRYLAPHTNRYKREFKEICQKMQKMEAWQKMEWGDFLVYVNETLKKYGFQSYLLV